MAAAVACGVHCVLAPLAVGALAVVPAQWLFSTFSEAAFLAVTVALGVASLIPSYRAQHRRKSCMALFVAGAITLAVAKLAMHDHQLEPWLLGAGAVMIAAAHLANLHFCRTCSHCHSH